MKIVPVSVYLDPVVSDGVSGKDAIKDLKRSGCRVGGYVPEVMSKSAYVVTNGKVYKPVVLLGKDFEKSKRTTFNIRKIAEEMHLITPPAELAYLLHRSTSVTKMGVLGVWALIVMHEPIPILPGLPPYILGTYYDDTGQHLGAYNGRHDITWCPGNGFVFLAPAGEMKKILPYHLNEVVSDGVLGRDSGKIVQRFGYRVIHRARKVMSKPAYVVTKGNGYKPVVLLGGDFTDDERTTSNIRRVAEEMRLITPPAELARLIRKSTSDSALAGLGLGALIVMHEPVVVERGDPYLLCAHRYGDGQSLDAYPASLTSKWAREHGFVFLAPRE
jgi:hypothetical protein